MNKINNDLIYKIDHNFLIRLGYVIEDQGEEEYCAIPPKNKDLPYIDLFNKNYVNFKYWQKGTKYHRDKDLPAIINYIYKNKQLIGITKAWYIEGLNFRKNEKYSFVSNLNNILEFSWTNKEGHLDRKRNPAIEKYEDGKLIEYTWYDNGNIGREEYYYPTKKHKEGFQYFKSGYDITKEINKFIEDNFFEFLNLSTQEIELIEINFSHIYED